MSHFLNDNDVVFNRQIMNKNGLKRVNNIREQGLDTADNHFGDKLVDCVKNTYRFEVL